MRIYHRFSDAILSPVLLLTSRPDHLPQFVLLGKLARECAKILDQVVACSQHGLLGSDLPVGLDAQLHLMFKRVRNLSSIRQDIAQS